jgi:hypothetical protein
MRGKRLHKELELLRPKADIEIAGRVPGNGLNVQALLQLSENSAGHSLHAGVLRRPARARDVYENFH